MKSTIFLFALLIVFPTIGCKKQTIELTKIKRVGTLGDSITRGNDSINIAIAISKLLPDDYEVVNYAVGSTCLVKNCFNPIWETSKFKQLLEDEPDIITIMLGTNDASTKNSDEVRANFENDYRDMIELFKRLNSKPEILLCYPPPLSSHFARNDSIIKYELIPIIDKLASDYGLNIANTHYLVHDYPSNYPDNIHPNRDGVITLAKIIAYSLGF